MLLFAAGWLPGKDARAPDYGPRAESPIWLYNGHACQLFKARLTQEEAGEKCKAMGGHLAIVDTAEENTFLWRKVQGIKGVIFADICMSSNSGESAQGMMLEIDRVRVIARQTAAATRDINDPNYDAAGLAYGFFCEWGDPATARRMSPRKDTVEAEVSAPAAAKAPARPVLPAAAAAKPSARKVSGNFQYAPDDLNKFEQELDYVEQTFWDSVKAKKAGEPDPGYEKRLFAWAALAGNIQASLVAEKKQYDGIDIRTLLPEAKTASQNGMESPPLTAARINLPKHVCKIVEAWKFFNRDKPDKRFIYKELLTSERKLPYDYKEYLRSLPGITDRNTAAFQKYHHGEAARKGAEVFQALMELRAEIVAVDAMNLFAMNPKLKR